ncbi:hypothetical protein BaRGS_00016797 [Batillaria attramentaria]|uniref:N-acetyltransferase domain-containing protein n=1 Tax=Batillaria attramentaria TaxID=370345 RepID=A0ABD0KXD6_9CAEN
MSLSNEFWCVYQFVTSQGKGYTSLPACSAADERLIPAQRSRGGFPPPPRDDNLKPRGGFGLPPGGIKSLKEAVNDMTIKEVKGSCAGRLFAQLSRQVTGYNYSIPEGGSALFAFCPGRSEPAGAVVFTMNHEGTEQNIIDFQFVHPRYQRMGIGKKLVLEAMEVMAVKNGNDVYLEAAIQARDFYKKLGFQDWGAVVETQGPGADIFKRMQPMKRRLTDYSYKGT